MPPLRYTARLEDKIKHNEQYIQYMFELVEPNELVFEAGQYISLKVTERGDRRSYSICSNPEITHGIELLIDQIPEGVGCQYLENLQFGDQIEFMAPLGQFVIAKDQTEEALVLIATGSGIAPYKSIIEDLLQVKADKRPITLYWGLRHAEKMFWQDDFRQLAEAFDNFKFHPVISQAVEDWPLCRGRVTDCLAVHALPENAGYYLCGNATMIKDVSELLMQKGVNSQRIHHEKFH